MECSWFEIEPSRCTSSLVIETKISCYRNDILYYKEDAKACTNKILDAKLIIIQVRLSAYLT